MDLATKKRNINCEKKKDKTKIKRKNPTTYWAGPEVSGGKSVEWKIGIGHVVVCHRVFFWVL